MELLQGGVLTERRVGPWHECWIASYLMGLHFAGVPFPYTVEERDRDDPTNAAGNLPEADGISETRYHTKLAASATPLAELLVETGIGVVLNGDNSKLPTGLHRWDPLYMGLHTVFVIPWGDGSCQWYDPEATMGYAGERVANEVIIKWALGGADNVRVAQGAETMGPDPALWTGLEADFTSGATLYSDAARTSVYEKGWPGNKQVGVLGFTTIPHPTFPDAAVCINISAGAGKRAYPWIGANHIVPGTLKVRPGGPDVTGIGQFTQADLNKAATDAATAAKAETKQAAVSAVEAI